MRPLFPVSLAIIGIGSASYSTIEKVPVLENTSGVYASEAASASVCVGGSQGSSSEPIHSSSQLIGGIHPPINQTASHIASIAVKRGHPFVPASPVTACEAVPSMKRVCREVPTETASSKEAIVSITEETMTEKHIREDPCIVRASGGNSPRRRQQPPTVDPASAISSVPTVSTTTPCTSSTSPPLSSLKAKAVRGPKHFRSHTGEVDRFAAANPGLSAPEMVEPLMARFRSLGLPNVSGVSIINRIHKIRSEWIQNAAMEYPPEWVDIVSEIVNAYPTWSEDMLTFTIRKELSSIAEGLHVSRSWVRSEVIKALATAPRSAAV